MNKIGKKYKKIFFLSVFAQLLACTQFSFAESMRESMPTDPQSQKYLKVNADALKPFVASIVEPKLMDGCQGLTQGIINCYIRLQRGQDLLPLDDLLEAAPELAQKVSEDLNTIAMPDMPTRAKAPRPSVGAPVVGPGTCDLKPVIDLLNTLQCTLDQCCRDILNSLTNIHVVASCTVDFNTVFTVLVDIKTTITDCCAEIINTITNLNIVASCTIDFNPVFTIIVDIKNTITACCNDIIVTVTTCCENVIVTVTSCCENVIVTVTTCCSDIINTITNLNIISSCTVDFSPVFTVLVDIKNTITECCSDIIVTLSRCCTTIGFPNDLIPGCTQFVPPLPFDYDCLPSTTNSEFHTTDFNIIQWLKAIYARIGQLSGF